MDGTVRDINTGRIVKTTPDIGKEFLQYLWKMKKEGMRFYVVHGRSRLLGQRAFLNQVSEMGVPRVYDARCEPDRCYAIEGDPEEWKHDGEHRHGYNEVGDY